MRRLSIFAFSCFTLAALAHTTSCRTSPRPTSEVDATTPVDATSASSAPADGGVPKLTAFASADDLRAYMKNLVREADEKRNAQKAKRLAAIEAGAEAGPGGLWGDEIGDELGGGGLGLGDIGTIGHGTGTGTGQGYGAGSGKLSGPRPPAPRPAGAGASASITNTQVDGIDEGDIVKAHGDHLVVLRRGRLFTVHVGGGALAPVSTVDAFGPGISPKGAWYDEMLVAKDTVVVLGYSYERGGTELGLFDIDAGGKLTYRATYHLRSADYYSGRNYATRLVGDKLVLYAPASFSARAEDPLAKLPALRKWSASASPSAFAGVLDPSRIMKPIVPDLFMTLHAVTICSLSTPELECTSRGLLGHSGRVFYVSSSAVYVWTTPFSWLTPRTGKDAGAPTTMPPRSYVYRLPLDGSEPSVLRAGGAPIDQFSFHEENGHLDVLVRDEGNGDAMGFAEGPTTSVALLRVPLTAFTSAANVASPDAYTALPNVPGYALQNRFVGDHVLYGSKLERSAREPKRAERKLVTYRYASRSSAAAQALALDHDVERIEPIGSDALVVGSQGDDLVFSSIALGTDKADTKGRYVRKGAAQGETRSHGFFYRLDGDQKGVFGLPLHIVNLADGSAFDSSYHSGSAAVVFVRNDGLAFKELGTLTAPPAKTNDGCRASCVDWYGNSRPIFLGDRVLALMGYELVEAKVDGDTLRTARRASFAPQEKTP
ncbi:MAG: beta-propeller domain-containing protein [Myxococcales bacterium]|nr:beta-propeller domain-containing protein [Myxococcales bacterium]